MEAARRTIQPPYWRYLRFTAKLVSKAKGHGESPCAQNERALDIVYSLGTLHQRDRARRPVVFKELHATDDTFN